MKVNVRVFDCGGDSAVYQDLETGKVELVTNGSVVASATPRRPANYNRIVSKIVSYLSSYVEGTRNTIHEDGVELPKTV